MKKFNLVLCGFAALALAGCKTVPAPEPDVFVESITLPPMSDADLSCAVEPPVPQPLFGYAKLTEEQAEKYIVALRAAGRDCRNRLEAVSEIWRATEAKQAAVSRAIRPSE